jgi:hypothetical protein
MTNDYQIQNQITPIIRHVVYMPPSPTLIAELARQACTQLGQRDSAYNNPEVVGGLTAFLIFMSQRLATYANKGYKELIPKIVTVNRRKGA